MTSTPEGGIVEEGGALTVTCDFHPPTFSLALQLPQIHSVNWYWTPLSATSGPNEGAGQERGKIGIFTYRALEREGERKMVWNRRVPGIPEVKVRSFPTFSTMTDWTRNSPDT